MIRGGYDLFAPFAFFRADPANATFIWEGTGMFLSSLFITLLMGTSVWTPTNVTQFWTTPNEPTVFRFSSGELSNSENVKFEVWTTDGELFLTGEGKVEENLLSVDATLPQGFFELVLPGSDQTFGVACQPSYWEANRSGMEDQRDSFFAIDSASTWLVQNDSAREDLLKNARRMGLATYRERLNWSRIENKEGCFNFEGDNRSESLRMLAKQNDMPILELFHDAPDWTSRIGKFPEDLIKTADAWGTIGKRWNQYWNSIEVWNEPDILFSGDLPADQYVPVLKTVANEFSRQGIETPIVGGIIASFRDDYMDSLAENGAVDACDYFSFHTYCRAYDMEDVCIRYLRWLEKKDAEWKPVWITECGRPWKKGTSRPDRESDLASAIDIVQKGVAAKALGIDAYFPFVFPYYEENDNNFGMCDINNAPLRSCAGYARSVALLSGKRCVGSLAFPDGGAERSYLFVDCETAEKIAVFYSRDRIEGRRLTLPFSPLFVERVTGERLEVAEDGSVDFRDGFLFVGLPEDCEYDLSESTDVDTIRRVRHAARVKHGVDPRHNYPIVLRYDFDGTAVCVANGGYRILDSTADTFSGSLSVFNFDTHEKTLPFSLAVAVEDENGKSTFERLNTAVPESISVPGRERVTIPFSIDLTNLYPFSVSKLFFQAGDSTLSFSVSQSVDEYSFRKFSSLICKLDIRALDQWRKSSSSNGQIGFIDGLLTNDDSDDRGWGFTAKFSDKSDRWAYPVFPLPFDAKSGKLTLTDAEGRNTEHALSEFKGIAFRIKGTSNDSEGVLRFFTFDERGNYYFTGVPLAPTDGQERFIALPFASLSPYGGVTGRFDANQVRGISFGCNSHGDETSVQLGDVFLFK